MMNPEETKPELNQKETKPEQKQEPKQKNPKRVAAGKKSAKKRAENKAELEALRKIKEVKQEIDPSEITKPVDDQPSQHIKVKLEDYSGLFYGFCVGLVGVGAYYYLKHTAEPATKPAAKPAAKPAKTPPRYNDPFDD